MRTRSRIIEKKYPDIVEPVSPQFNDDMSTQAETFGDQNASQNTNHGNGYGHDVSTLGRSAKFFGFATAVAFFLLAVFVSTLFYALKTGGEIKLKQSPSGSALQANQQIFDRMVGESLARAGQINVTEETPFKSATTSKTEVLPERDLMGGFALNWS